IAGPGIDDVGVGRVYGQRRDLQKREVIGERSPGGSAIGGLPDAAAGSAEVVGSGVVRIEGDGVDPAAGRAGAVESRKGGRQIVRAEILPGGAVVQRANPLPSKASDGSGRHPRAMGGGDLVGAWVYPVVRIGAHAQTVEKGIQIVGSGLCPFFLPVGVRATGQFVFYLRAFSLLFARLLTSGSGAFLPFGFLAMRFARSGFHVGDRARQGVNRGKGRRQSGTVCAPRRAFGRLGSRGRWAVLRRSGRPPISDKEQRDRQAEQPGPQGNGRVARVQCGDDGLVHASSSSGGRVLSGHACFTG